MTQQDAVKENEMGTSGLTFYLAARYSRREELCDYRSDLEARGHTAPARWLLGEHQVHGVEAAREVEQAGPVPSEQARLFATDDIADINEADVFVAFTEVPRAQQSGRSRGGRHVELGYALAMRRHATWAPRIFIVGPLENVFTALPEVDAAFDTWADLLAALDRQPEIHGWSRSGNERCHQHPWHATNTYHSNWYGALALELPA